MRSKKGRRPPGQAGHGSGQIAVGPALAAGLTRNPQAPGRRAPRRVAGSDSAEPNEERDPGDVDVGGAAAAAGLRRAVRRIAVVADELDRRDQVAGGPRAERAAARTPAEVAREAPGRAVPGRLRAEIAGRDQVERGTVAVRRVARLPRRGERAGRRSEGSRPRRARSGRRRPAARNPAPSAPLAAGGTSAARRGGPPRAGSPRPTTVLRRWRRPTSPTSPKRRRQLEHVGHVPVGVVVGEDRPVPVAGRARGAQVVGGAVDRVGRLVAVLVARRRCRRRRRRPRCAAQELHRPTGPGLSSRPR